MTWLSRAKTHTPLTHLTACFIQLDVCEKVNLTPLLHFRNLERNTFVLSQIMKSENSMSEHSRAPDVTVKSSGSQSRRKKTPLQIPLYRKNFYIRANFKISVELKESCHSHCPTSSSYKYVHLRTIKNDQVICSSFVQTEIS